MLHKNTYQLEANQREAVDRCKAVIRKAGSCILKGQLGSGKSFMSVSIAQELGYQNVLFITEPSLPVPHEIPDLNIVKLSYSKFRKKRNSAKAAMESAKSLIEGVDDSYFIIADEFTNIKNIDAQTTQVWLAIRSLLPNNPLLMMSGTIRTTYNRDLIPILYSMSMYAGCMPLRQYIAHVRETCDRYTAKVPLPHINKHATKFEDRNTDELKQMAEQYMVEVARERDGDISLYERHIELEMPSKTANLLTKLRRQNNFELKDGTFIRYAGDSSLRKLCDGFVEIIDPVQNAYEPCDIKYVHHDIKIEAIKAIEKAHRGSKIIVLTSYLEGVKLLADKLSEAGYRCLSAGGDSTPTHTQKTIASFKSEPVTFLIGTVQKLSTGHSLDEADVTIYHSVPSAYKDLEQAYGRTDRKTTTRNKYYYWLYYTNYEKAKATQRIAKVEESMVEWGFGKDDFIEEHYTLGEFTNDT